MVSMLIVVISVLLLFSPYMHADDILEKRAAQTLGKPYVLDV